jgi:putative ABC transport system permease protein
MQNIGDTFGQVFRAIAANKVRSFLTMFGIAWGVGSMLLLISVGEGFRSGQHRQLASIGNDVIMMWGGTIPAVPSQHTGMRPYYLTLDDEAAMRASGKFRQVMAMVRRSDLKQQSQYESAGESVLLNGTSFRVVGVAAKTGRGNDDGTNQQIYIPLTTMLEMFPIKGENLPQNALSSIQYQPLVRGESESAKAAARQIIASRHDFSPDNPDAFEEWDTIKSDQLVGRIFTAMDIFLGGVGIVTLALGAVGIVNIMLVSVSERTREIGLRKAIGATKRSILMQFFLEGLLLTGVSGLIGIGGSWLFMYLVQTAVGENGVPGFDPPRLVPWSAALAMGALCLSGIFAGLYPASKAAQLEPVEALRRE